MNRTEQPSVAEQAHMVKAMRRLVQALQELSLARHRSDVVRVVRTVARELTAADGATFILRDRDLCHYVDEDAIGPLWRGQKFPMTACVSGWSMLHRRAAVIPDIYDDPRVPVDAYRPTFVKSLVMVPIRTQDPIGAIGTYWARPYHATAFEVELLQSLANTTSVALENARVYEELEMRVAERTQQLQIACNELEAFSYSASHDLRNPLTSIGGLAYLAAASYPKDGPADVLHSLETIQNEVRRMSTTIDAMLRLAALNKAEPKQETVNLTTMAREIVDRLRARDAGRAVDVRIEGDLVVRGDAGMLASVLENLLSNAWKYTARCERGVIHLARFGQDEHTETFIVRDNGVGFDARAAERLFEPFRRFHAQEEFPGTGVGLATVRRIVERHGGRIWAESEVGRGATFYFTLARPRG